MTQTFALHTLGCRLNQYEIESIGVRLEALGFQQVQDREAADVTVINTCTVTARADADARNLIRRARRVSPGGRIVVTGCYAHVEPGQIEALGEVDLLVDNHDKDRLVRRLVEAFGYALPHSLDLNRLEDESFAVTDFRNHTRAMVKIQDGCQEACSYCVIPRARGRERSRAPETILREIRLLQSNGFKEVVLTGVHVGKYRWEDWRLADLIRAILDRTCIERIRLTSMEPREFRPPLIDLLLAEPRLCPHLHVPLQSGDDRILRAMRRSYDTAFARGLLERLAGQRPGLAIGTDVITGFPGETEEMFACTETFLKSLPLAYLHVFSYSRRPGTIAARMDGQVPRDVIRQRTGGLRSLSRSMRQQFMRRHVGEIVPVLFERRRDRFSGRLVGMSGNYIRVMTEGADDFMNAIVPVRIVRIEDEAAVGKPSRA